jgi:hypothetical protein
MKYQSREIDLIQNKKVRIIGDNSVIAYPILVLNPFLPSNSFAPKKKIINRKERRTRVSFFS